MGASIGRDAGGEFRNGAVELRLGLEELGNGLVHAAEYLGDRLVDVAQILISPLQQILSQELFRFDQAAQCVCGACRSLMIMILFVVVLIFVVMIFVVVGRGWFSVLVLVAAACYYMSKRKQFVFFIGLAGSGKSSAINSILPNPDAPVRHDAAPNQRGISIYGPIPYHQFRLKLIEVEGFAAENEAWIDIVRQAIAPYPINQCIFVILISERLDARVMLMLDRLCTGFGVDFYRRILLLKTKFTGFMEALATNEARNGAWNVARGAANLLEGPQPIYLMENFIYNNMIFVNNSSNM
jgi:hypothetical protein